MLQGVAKKKKKKTFKEGRGTAASFTFISRENNSSLFLTCGVSGYSHGTIDLALVEAQTNRDREWSREK